MKPWMTDAIGTQKIVSPSSVVQALFATSEKFSMPGDVVDRREVALVEEVERGVERPAGDEVAGGAVFEARVQRRVVFGRHARFEDDLDVRVRRLEGGNDLTSFQIAVSAFRQLSIVSVG